MYNVIWLYTFSLARIEENRECGDTGTLPLDKAEQTNTIFFQRGAWLMGII